MARRKSIAGVPVAHWIHDVEVERIAPDTNGGTPMYSGLQFTIKGETISGDGFEIVVGLPLDLAVKVDSRVADLLYGGSK